MTLYDIKYSYGDNNVKQLGSKIIVIGNGTVYGYDIISYSGCTPVDIGNRVHAPIASAVNKTDYNNKLNMFDRAYGFLYGNPIYNY